MTRVEEGSASLVSSPLREHKAVGASFYSHCPPSFLELCDYADGSFQISVCAKQSTFTQVQ